MPDHRDAPSGNRSLRLSMEIELDAEPIRGAVSISDGDRRPFTGWLGLSAALEALRGESGDDNGAELSEVGAAAHEKRREP